jgi:very-short-patch-repair endonuclease
MVEFSFTNWANYNIYSEFVKRIIQRFQKIFIKNKNKKLQNKKMKDYYPKNLQTNVELILFNMMKKELQNYYIAPQVAMSAIVQTPIYKKRAQFRTYYVDYIICDEKGEKPLLVIELDDTSHNNERREIQDKRKNTVLQLAEIPLLRIRVGENFKEKIENEIKPILRKEKIAPRYEMLNLEKEPQGCLSFLGKAAIIFITLLLL